MKLASLRKILVIAWGILYGIPTLAADIHIPAKQRVYVEARSADINEIFITEVQSGRKAILSLNPVVDRAERNNGYFLLDMGPVTKEQQTFEILDKMNRPIFGYVMTVKKSKFLALVVFKTSIERDQFAEKVRANPTLTTSIKTNAKNQNANIVQGSPTKQKVELQRHAVEQTRLNLELALTQKRQASIAKFEQLSPSAQKQQKDKAQSLTDSGFKFFKAGDYASAGQQYLQAMDLDPTSDQTYFQHAINLYRQNKHNESLVYLSTIQGGDINSSEYSYYVALNHMKFREYDKAVKGFSEIREENNPELSPISAFYAGNLQFKMQDYSGSKENFQYVLDNSTDPKMDNEAEAMIEKINQVEQYLESLKEIFRYTLTGGLIYDENILNVSANNTTSNTKGYRFLYGANIYYHLHRAPTTQAALSLSYNDMYSMDTKFKADSTLQGLDPQIITIAVPIQKQFELMKEKYSYSVTPSHMLLTMNTDGTGRKHILSTTGLANSLMSFSSTKRVGIYNFDLSKDQSQVTASSSDDSLTGSRFKVGTSQVWLIGNTSQRNVTGDISYSLFTAEGKNNTNNKIDTTVIYGFPGAWGITTSTKIGYSLLKYPDAGTSRADNTWTAGILGIKNFGGLSLAGNLDYIMNSSTIEQYKYNKFVATIVLSYSGSVSRK